jgi:transketolase
MNKDFLSDDIFSDPKKAATRDGFGEALLHLGETDPRVVAVCADLAESTKTLAFKQKYPERYIEIGVAEQNLATLAAGLAAVGKIPFIASYAAFNPGRNNEQIRTTIALNDVPVKVCGMHAGVSVGPDGATHQALEDLALMRAVPNMTVIYPCDSTEAKKATLAAAAFPGPVYLRFAREKSPVITRDDVPFEIGKATVAWDSERPQVAIIATGPLLYEALKAAKAIESEMQVIVLSVPTIKPLDTGTIVEAARRAGAVVTVEEHQLSGGLGDAVASALAAHYPVPMEFVGVADRFGQSGTVEELYAEYGLDSTHIAAKVRAASARRK